jgi:nucleoside-diphosphate-sugar epimerase
MNIGKVIVAGATGYIGKSLYSKIQQDRDVLGTSRAGGNGLIKLDLLTPKLFDYKIVNLGDVVIMTSAISAPNICSEQFDYAHSVNVSGTSLFIEEVISRGGRVIFLSSDTVYGAGGGFSEESALNPAGEYAVMKSEVEKRFILNNSFKVARLSYVFSSTDKFTQYINGCAVKNIDAEIFHPFYRSVIYRNDVVDGLIELALNWDIHPDCIFNFGGSQLLSRVDMASALKDLVFSNLNFRVIQPEPSFFEKRPQIIEMSSNYLSNLLGRPPLLFEDAIKTEFNL